MYEKIESCPVCSNNKFTNEIICNDYSISNEQFVIVRCDHCKFLLTNPRPLPDRLSSYYESDNYVSHSNKANNIINLAYKIARYFTLRSKHKLIQKCSNKDNSLLDYGCGTGSFLTFCKNKGWKVAGIEPNEKARKIASNDSSIRIEQKLEHLDPKDSYAIITLWHVLEHIPDLNNALEKIATKLSKKGTLIIAVPNPESWDAQHYKKYWAGYDVPRHLYHFTQSSVKQLMKNHKLKVKNIVPMKLDSYYVSLLSETYSKSKNKYFKALLNGYKSNSYARKNNNNYSSLIYIVQK